MPETKPYILVIDQGTTSSRIMIFDAQGVIIGQAQKEFPLFYPENGWVEQDADLIWQDILEIWPQALGDAGLSMSDISAIGITNQRETIVVWDGETGKPLHHAIVWQDRRTADRCAGLKEQGLEPEIQEKTGLLLDPYFSASKLQYLLDHVPEARDLASAGHLKCGTMDTYLIWKMTAGASYATDATNASRTMLFNIQTQNWDERLCEIFNIPMTILPEVKDCAGDFGQVNLFDCQTPITGVAGDQQAALFGQACYQEGMVKSTYGTGCFMLMNIGADFKTSNHKLLTTVGYRLNGQVTYAFEGAIFIAGAAIQWLRDGLQIVDHASESEKLAQSVKDNGGVYFVPALTGLGAPYWQPHARGMISGITRDTGRAHFARAALEAQAYQTLDLFSAMVQDSGQGISELRVDGGLVANKWMCQFLSDMTQVPVQSPIVTETTALGAAYLAALGAGIYQDVSDIADKWQVGSEYAPQQERLDTAPLFEAWQKNVKAVMAISE